MKYDVEQRLQLLSGSGSPGLFRGRLTGLEKEGLRVSADGRISQRRHPEALGAALTHAHITTDYSEALLELITPPREEVTQGLSFLDEISRFVHMHLNGEVLWASSMPCILEGEESIPIAEYGRSNVGRMKNVYRRGLGHRYGRVMQIISGIHFNFSFPERYWHVLREHEQDSGSQTDFISRGYFHTIRNVQRFGWLVLYLFGASPSLCRSFFSGRSVSLDPTPELEEFGDTTYYEPYATSIRMSDVGYKNSLECKAGIEVCYDKLESYVAALRHAIRTPCPPYERIGVFVNGEWRQLNANILQIENEYYSTIRPKQIADPHEKPSTALSKRGVRYLELRSLDLDPLQPLGLQETQLRFLEAWLILCQLHSSPLISGQERDEINFNQAVTATRGRAPGLKLRRGEKEQLLGDWAREILDDMQSICEYLDLDEIGSPYAHALNVQRAAIDEPELTPSAKVLREMREAQEDFFEFAMRMSRQHCDALGERPLDEDSQRFFERLGNESVQRQQELEASDATDFRTYLTKYFESD